MNTQNFKTAASESTETGGKRINLNGIPEEMRENLQSIIVLSLKMMSDEERRDVLTGILINMAESISKSVTDWSQPVPVLPVTSMVSWFVARDFALSLYGDMGGRVWDLASQVLGGDLITGCKLV